VYCISCYWSLDYSFRISCCPSIILSDSEGCWLRARDFYWRACRASEVGSKTFWGLAIRGLIEIFFFIYSSAGLEDRILSLFIFLGNDEGSSSFFSSSTMGAVDSFLKPLLSTLLLNYGFSLGSSLSIFSNLNSVSGSLSTSKSLKPDIVLIFSEPYITLMSEHVILNSKDAALSGHLSMGSF
jgi:hypothetical protein